jgi:hypothetical protein
MAHVIATVLFFVRNRETDEFEQDGVPLHFRDDGIGETDARIRARAYAERWAAEAPDDRRFEIR